MRRVEGSARVRLPARDLTWRRNQHGFGRVILKYTDGTVTDLPPTFVHLESLPASLPAEGYDRAAVSPGGRA